MLTFCTFEHFWNLEYTKASKKNVQYPQKRGKSCYFWNEGCGGPDNPSQHLRGCPDPPFQLPQNRRAFHASLGIGGPQGAAEGTEGEGTPPTRGCSAGQRVGGQRGGRGAGWTSVAGRPYRCVAAPTPREGVPFRFLTSQELIETSHTYTSDPSRWLAALSQNSCGFLQKLHGSCCRPKHE